MSEEDQDSKRVKTAETTATAPSSATTPSTWTSSASVNFGEVPSWLTNKKTTTTTGAGDAKKEEAVPAWLSKGSSTFGPSASFGQSAATFGGGQAATFGGGSAATFGGGATFGSQAATFGSLSGQSVFGGLASAERKRPAPSASKKDDEGESGSEDDDDEGSDQGGANGDDAVGHAPAGWGSSSAEEALPPPNEVASGEEGEQQVIQMRVKLFRLIKKDDKPSWGEVGSGPLRVNVPVKTDDDEGEDAPKKKPRIIMRREGVLKLLLNAVLLPEFTFEAVGDKMLRFACESYTDDSRKGEIATFLVRCSRTEDRKQLMEAIDRVKLKKSSAASPSPSTSSNNDSSASPAKTDDGQSAVDKTPSPEKSSE